MKIIEGFVKERLEERKLGGKIRATNDFLDELLDYEGDGKEGPRKFSLQNVNIIVLVSLLLSSRFNMATKKLDRIWFNKVVWQT